jgi:hypothetical protein
VCNIPYFPNFRLDTPYPYCNPEIVVVTGTSDFNTAPTLNNKINIFPNPSDGIIYVNDPEQMAYLRFYDLNGRMMVSIESPHHIIDISGLNAGLYIVLIVNKDNTVTSQKIVIR